jgi:hypothetical protein
MRLLAAALRAVSAMKPRRNESCASFGMTHFLGASMLTSGRPKAGLRATSICVIGEICGYRSLDEALAAVAKSAMALAWRLTSTRPSLAGLVIGAKGFTSPGFQQ